MQLRQEDAEISRQKNDFRRKNQEIMISECGKSGDSEKDVENSVLRSQSTASMMMELSSLPISSCGAVAESNVEIELIKPHTIKGSTGVSCSPKMPQAQNSHNIPTIINPLKLSETTKPIIPKHSNQIETSLPISSNPIIKPNFNSQSNQQAPLPSNVETKVTITSDSSHSNLAPIKVPQHQVSQISTIIPSQSSQSDQKSTLPQHKVQGDNCLPSTPTPLKAMTYIHLSAKYKDELQYMLVEFRKLEQQLRSGSKNGVEGQGSRARREKLHSFILHVEDTAKQIEAGFQQLKDVKLTQIEDEDTKPRNLEEEESVQRLEEHILANLLPVKARLVKQLTDQGKRVGSLNNGPRKANPGPQQSTPPSNIPRGYPQPQYHGPVAFSGSSSGPNGPTTSSNYSIGPPHASSAVESQYGRPLAGNKGSSLTKKLHGQTLGNAEEVGTIAEHINERKNDSLSSSASESTPSTAAFSDQGLNGEDGMNFDEAPSSPQRKKRKILFAGLAPGSDLKSKMNSVAAAAGTDAASAQMYEKLEHLTKKPHEMETSSAFIESNPPVLKEYIESAPVATTNTQQRKEVIPIPLNVNYRPPLNQPKAVVPPSKFTKQIKKKAVVSPLPTSIVLPASTTQRKSITLKKPVGSSFLSRGPASAAADAVATSIAKSRIKHIVAQTKPQIMPPPAPVLSGCSVPLKNIVIDSKDKQSQIAKKERRKRRLEKRRRRRKRRKSRLRAITEAFRVSSPMISHHRNGTVLHPSSQYAHHPVGNIRDGDRYKSNMHSNVHGAKAIGMVSGAFPKIRTIEYKCSHCNEPYVATCEFNPWWALTQEDCPKCRKTQIPRIDITAPANAIEYHPALLAHAEDGSGNGGNANNSSANSNANASLLHNNSSGKASLLHANRTNGISGNHDSDNEIHPEDEIGLDDDGESSDESMDGDPLEEDFGKDYTGPKLTDDEAVKLLLLIEHASTCPGRHKSLRHGQICNSVKYMMLHVRDCPGVTTCSGDVCPFPWCRKVKHLLYHLVSCVRPHTCHICRPCNLPKGLDNLRNLNKFRRKRQQDQARKKAAADRINTVKRPYVVNKNSMIPNAQRPSVSASSIMPNKHIPTTQIGMNGVNHKQIRPNQVNGSANFPPRPLVSINKSQPPHVKLTPPKAQSQNVKLMPPPMSKYNKVSFKPNPQKNKITHPVSKHMLSNPSKPIAIHPGAIIQGQLSKTQYTIQNASAASKLPMHKTIQVQIGASSNLVSKTNNSPQLVGSMTSRIHPPNPIVASTLLNKENTIANNGAHAPISSRPMLGPPKLQNERKIPIISNGTSNVLLAPSETNVKNDSTPPVVPSNVLFSIIKGNQLPSKQKQVPPLVNPPELPRIPIQNSSTGNEVPHMPSHDTTNETNIQKSSAPSHSHKFPLMNSGVKSELIKNTLIRSSHPKPQEDAKNLNKAVDAKSKPIQTQIQIERIDKAGKKHFLSNSGESPSQLPKLLIPTPAAVTQNCGSNSKEMEKSHQKVFQLSCNPINSNQVPPDSSLNSSSNNPPSQTEIPCTNEASKERSELHVSC